MSDPRTLISAPVRIAIQRKAEVQIEQDFAKNGPTSVEVWIRIAFSVGLVLLASYVVFVYLIVDVQQRFYLDQIVREAGRFSSAVMSSTYSNMLHGDPEATKSFLKDIGKQKEVSDVRIYSHNGLIKFSNNPQDVGQSVDMKSEACVACHPEGQTFQ